jgi:dihydroorotase
MTVVLIGVVDPSNIDAGAQDIVIEESMIAAVMPTGTNPALAAAASTVVRAPGSFVMPAFVDLHTHLREPGRTQSEDTVTASAGAAAGGYSAVFAMANTEPVADCAQVVEAVAQRGRDAGLVHVSPVGAITQGLQGLALADLGGMAASAAAVRMFSDDGHCVDSAAIMRSALQLAATHGWVIAQHSQEGTMTAGAQMNEGEVSRQLGMPGWPGVAEAVIIARDVLLAADTGGRLHVCHVSTAAAVDVLRWAKSRGVNVTAEVTPHHLLLTDDLVGTGDAVFKVNPPLRTRSDVQAVREALADGTIDVVATDHAPHPDDAKCCGWTDAAMGMLGLQTALPVVAESMVASGLMTWEQLVARMSITPARIGGLSRHGQTIAAGAPANVTVVDPDAAWVVDPATLESKSANTPFAHRSMHGQVVATVFEGRLTYAEGKVRKP